MQTNILGGGGGREGVSSMTMKRDNVIIRFVINNITEYTCCQCCCHHWLFNKIIDYFIIDYNVVCNTYQLQLMLKKLPKVELVEL